VLLNQWFTCATVHPASAQGSGFRVKGLGLRVEGVWFRGEGSGGKARLNQRSNTAAARQRARCDEASGL